MSQTCSLSINVVNFTISANRKWMKGERKNWVLFTTEHNQAVNTNKGNSSIPLFKLINPWTKNKIGVTN